MICNACVYMSSLYEFISKNGSEEKCSFCEEVGICVSDKKLFKHIEKRLSEILTSTDDLSGYEHAMIYECGSDEPPIYSIWGFLGDGSDVADEAVIEKLLEYLPDEYNKTIHGDDAHFVIDDGTLEHNDFSEKWNEFVESIHHDRRFFNNKAELFLDSLFETIIGNSTLDNNAISEISAETPLFRARIAHGRNDIKIITAEPHSQLGLVPKSMASSQRMTPAGISSLYCSLDRNTCLCELRSIVGDIVISGAFKAITGLKLIDLSLLADACKASLDKLDYFHEGFRSMAHAFEFLKDITFKLSKPLGRQDELGYLSTQVFFEYLRVKYSDSVDGVIFKSVQNNGNGENIALFPESSSVSEKNKLLLPDTDASLHFCEGSLVYHRIKAVAVTSKDFDSSFPFEVDGLMKRRLFGSEDV